MKKLPYLSIQLGYHFSVSPQWALCFYASLGQSKLQDCFINSAAWHPSSAGISALFTISCKSHILVQLTYTARIGTIYFPKSLNFLEYISSFFQGLVVVETEILVYKNKKTPTNKHRANQSVIILAIYRSRHINKNKRKKPKALCTWLPYFPFYFFQLRTREMFFCWMVSDYGSEILGCSLNAQFLPSWGGSMLLQWWHISISAQISCICFPFPFLSTTSLMLSFVKLFFVLTGDLRNPPLPASWRN